MGVTSGNSLYNRILKYEGADNNKTPVFSMVKVDGEYPTQTYETYKNYTECWKLQVGVKYFFN